MKNTFKQEIIDLLKEMTVAFLQSIKMFFIDLKGKTLQIFTLWKHYLSLSKI